MAECPYCGSKIPVGTHVCPFCDAHLRPLEVGHAEEAEALEEEVTKEVPAEKPAEEQPKPEEPAAEEPVPETPAEEPGDTDEETPEDGGTAFFRRAGRILLFRRAMADVQRC